MRGPAFFSEATCFKPGHSHCDELMFDFHFFQVGRGGEKMTTWMKRPHGEMAQRGFQPKQADPWALALHRCRRWSCKQGRGQAREWGGGDGRGWAGTGGNPAAEPCGMELEGRWGLLRARPEAGT